MHVIEGYARSSALLFALAFTLLLGLAPLSVERAHAGMLLCASGKIGADENRRLMRVVRQTIGALEFDPEHRSYCMNTRRESSAWLRTRHVPQPDGSEVAMHVSCKRGTHGAWQCEQSPSRRLLTDIQFNGEKHRIEIELPADFPVDGARALAQQSYDVLPSLTPRNHCEASNERATAWLQGLNDAFRPPGKYGYEVRVADDVVRFVSATDYLEFDPAPGAQGHYTFRCFDFFIIVA
jgi:hypothetical protein